MQLVGTVKGIAMVLPGVYGPGSTVPMVTCAKTFDVNKNAPKNRTKESHFLLQRIFINL